MSFQIAIDGPVAAGKGTVARLVAQRLGWLYVDTGAMYRMTAMLALKRGMRLSDEEVINEDNVAEYVRQSRMEMRNPTPEEQDGRLTTVFLDGEDVSWKIRTPEISRDSSLVAALAKVRHELVQKQQEIAAHQNVVMEGRDITYRVLPNAQLKIYLTAAEDARAQRRFFEYQTKGKDTTLEEVKAELRTRDDRDMHRAVDPLQKVADAWEIDTTNLTIEDVVEMIVARATELQNQKK